ncbi:hypothetical protein Hdeb2414_s0006g00198361 [Helianthus debilis subsp. tardiflorus]
MLVLILGMSYGTPDEHQARKENRTHVSKLPQRSYFVLVYKVDIVNISNYILEYFKLYKKFNLESFL